MSKRIEAVALNICRQSATASMLLLTLHKQVGNPQRRMQVVRTAAIIAGILAQVKELLDIEMPGFQIRTDRALALAALVHCHSSVADDLQEGDHPLALPIRTLDG